MVGACYSTILVVCFVLADTIGADAFDCLLWTSASSLAGFRMTDKSSAVMPLTVPASRDTDGVFASSMTLSGERGDSLLQTTEATWRKQKLILDVLKKTTICFCFGSSLTARPSVPSGTTSSGASILRLSYRLSVASTHLSCTRSTTRAGCKILSCRDMEVKYL